MGSPTLMMDAAGLTDSRDGKHEPFRAITIRMILSHVHNGAEYRDAVERAAEYVYELGERQGADETMCRGMRRMVVEIGATYAVELLTGVHD